VTRGVKTEPHGQEEGQTDKSWMEIAERG